MACTLNRTSTGSDGTFGSFTNQATGSSWYTAELEWRDNLPNLSCIPEGVYTVQWLNHPKHGWCYEVTNVPNRTAILIHVGNYAGAEDLGEKADFLGCIGLGKVLGSLVPPGYTKSQEAVENSTQAIAEFEGELKQETFQLVITNNFGGPNA